MEDLQFKLEEEEITLGDELKVYHLLCDLTKIMLFTEKFSESFFCLSLEVLER